MRDQLMPGTDIAVYWIEYVIRHGDTKHLKLSSRNMPFYQRHLLDVTFFLVSILVIFLIIAYKSTRLLLHWSDKNLKIKTN
jgi:glucuronosyltransferase